MGGRLFTREAPADGPVGGRGADGNRWRGWEGARSGGRAGLAPETVTGKKKAVMRIYRETRFSANKTPYKNHVAASFGRQGLKEGGGAGFYFSVNHKVVEVAGGLHHPPK